MEAAWPGSEHKADSGELGDANGTCATAHEGCLTAGNPEAQTWETEGTVPDHVAWILVPEKNLSLTFMVT